MKITKDEFIVMVEEKKNEVMRLTKGQTKHDVVKKLILKKIR
tara:strand:- start:3397 stop:3522 length:126 start_codon:yes stop_codon:yes gene_type:complete